MKNTIKKIGKALWAALPWVGLTIWLFCILSLPSIHASERGAYKAEIAALKAQVEAQESENARLADDVEWLRSLVVGQLQEARP